MKKHQIRVGTRADFFCTSPTWRKRAIVSERVKTENSAFHFATLIARNREELSLSVHFESSKQISDLIGLPVWHQFTLSASLFQIEFPLF